MGLRELGLQLPWTAGGEMTGYRRQSESRRP
jgi:hypothetical protein